MLIFTPNADSIPLASGISFAPMFSAVHGLWSARTVVSASNQLSCASDSTRASVLQKRNERSDSAVGKNQNNRTRHNK